jgi:uncharacterized repeat protein (TIGR03803 family)
MRRRDFSIGTAVLPGFLAILLLAGSVLAGGPKEHVLYRFNGGSDGNYPLASMTADKTGSLYGTTSLGGGSENCPSGCGTVFRLSPPPKSGGAWTESVIYSFQGGNDGANPEAPLIADKAGNLYGTTSAGGNGNCDNTNMTGCGTVFELRRPAEPGAAWTETVLDSFQGVPSGQGNGDAAWPNSLVFDKAGNLYGMAYDGGYCYTDETGTYCYGAAFKLKKPSRFRGGWSEKVIYRFDGPSGAPASAIFDKAGNLYGTAGWGAFGFGFVFRLKPPKKQGGVWRKASVYDFQGGSDGAFPQAGLVFDKAGNLYGASLGTGYGYSNIFQLSPTKGGTWSESVLYNFTEVSNGYVPTVGPILGKKGDLYGTTSEGGQFGKGVVFDLAPPGTEADAWTENVLYSFRGGSDGFAPYGGLTFGKGGALYGTTPSGGNMTCGNGNGCGTVFKVVP